jgi:hypothetical protein
VTFPLAPAEEALLAEFPADEFHDEFPDDSAPR